MKKDLYFNNEKLTQDSITKAEQFFIDNAQACIDEVINGKVKVNDPQTYIKQCKETISRYTNKTYTVSLTLLQKAYFFQTGKNVALL